jgi:hypothetical protein
VTVRDASLSTRSYFCVKSWAIALALAGIVWNAGPHARVQPDYDELSYTGDAGSPSKAGAADDMLALLPAERSPDAAEQPADEQNSAPAQVPAEVICTALDRSAADNDIPLDYFIRLIWQESRFNPRAVSHAGAQGIAQFMPGTARIRGLADPFDPSQAIPKSAELLRDLIGQFGNFGLAAAAYNAGPKRILDWLSGRRALPKETQNYVRIITGRPAEDWTAAEPAGADVQRRKLPPCLQLAAQGQTQEHAPRAVVHRAPGPAIIALRSVQQRRGTEAKPQQRIVQAARVIRGPTFEVRVRKLADVREVRVRKVADVRGARVADARAPRKAAAHPPKGPDIRTSRVADARGSRSADARDARPSERNRLLHLAAAHPRGGQRPKRVAHAM